MRKQGWNLENTYTELPKSFFSEMELNPVKTPGLIIFNSDLADKLGLDSEELKMQLDILSGNKAPENSIPIAKAYAGHQFGYFTILGDGRAMLLGEQITPEGDSVDIELKGSGRTPYSRGGDGRASVGPMIREYIMGEAMDALDIPTTRGLAVVSTGEKIRRQTMEDGAILTRIASSHIRVGTFEYAASLQNVNDIKQLADYTINRHFKEIKNDENPYLSLLKEVIKRQARLISKWQLVGFIHGVMNTDNMTISGETIDYGPCAFMDSYDLNTVFSSVDREERYSYGNQPDMGIWNLSRFAETLIPLINEDKDKAIELCKNELSKFQQLHDDYWMEGMKSKLGIFDEKPEDKTLIQTLLTLMHKYEADYTNTFKTLTLDECNNDSIFKNKELKDWYKLWKERLSIQEESFEESQNLMKHNNPSVIPRNHRVEEAIKAAESRADYSVMEELLRVLKNPFDYSDEHEEYSQLPPDTKISYKTYCGT